MRVTDKEIFDSVDIFGVNNTDWHSCILDDAFRGLT
ncbi:MAG: hypothetical protein ACI8RD_006403 [Bacillariaceae sp.]|jgi:hypothetical protein